MTKKSVGIINVATANDVIILDNINVKGQQYNVQPTM